MFVTSRLAMEDGKILPWRRSAGGSNRDVNEAAKTLDSCGTAITNPEYRTHAMPGYPQPDACGPSLASTGRAVGNLACPKH